MHYRHGCVGAHQADPPRLAGERAKRTTDLDAAFAHGLAHSGIIDPIGDVDDIEHGEPVIGGSEQIESDSSDQFNEQVVSLLVPLESGFHTLLVDQPECLTESVDVGHRCGVMEGAG